VVLFLHGLSVLAPELAYQVWLIPANGAPQSAGVFQVSQNQPFVTFPIAIPNPITNFADIGITIEPRGGSQAPTTSPILLIKFS
jgi:anti-sigma-K factor RskA